MAPDALYNLRGIVPRNHESVYEKVREGSRAALGRLCSSTCLRSPPVSVRLNGAFPLVPRATMTSPHRFLLLLLFLPASSLHWGFLLICSRGESLYYQLRQSPRRLPPPREPGRRDSGSRIHRPKTVVPHLSCQSLCLVELGPHLSRLFLHCFPAQVASPCGFVSPKTKTSPCGYGGRSHCVTPSSSFPPLQENNS